MPGPINDTTSIREANVKHSLQVDADQPAVAPVAMTTGDRRGQLATDERRRIEDRVRTVLTRRLGIREATKRILEIFEEVGAVDRDHG